MNPTEVLRIVDAIHRDKNIPKETIFEAIEAALVSALRKHYGEESDVVVRIDRTSGATTASCNGESLGEDVVGRIGAQTAKQVMIQKIREAERDSLFDEYTADLGQLVTGIVQRYEGGTATVTLNNTESILPRSEQIPGETHHVGERVRATICEVRKAGSRVKIILSRIRTDLVQRLFEQEIPEIADGVIEIRAMAREPGYRTKVAVSSTDQRVDCVGACVGVRGNRIKNIVDELAGERIDIVRWSDDMQVLIPNALQPAEVDEVILCPMLGRAIVLVREDQLSLAIGRRGQNVRLGSKLCGWDIEIMTREELDESIERAVASFSAMEGITPELAEALVGEGFLSYDDLSIIETEQLVEMGGLTEEQVERVREQAEIKAEEAERLAAEQRRKEREQAEREQAAGEQAAAGEPSPVTSEGTSAEGAGAVATGAGAVASDVTSAPEFASSTNGSAGHEHSEAETQGASLGNPSEARAAESRSEDGPSGAIS
jgi:N utilization substance protein A